MTLSTSDGGSATPHLRWVDSTGNVVTEFVSPALIVASNRPLLASIKTGQITGVATPYFLATDCTGTPYSETDATDGFDSVYIPDGSTLYARDLGAEKAEIEAHSHWTTFGCVTIGAGAGVLATAMAVVGELPAFSFPLHIEMLGDGPNF